MAERVLYKPVSQGQLNAGGLSFMLPNSGAYSGVSLYRGDERITDLTRSPYHSSDGVKFYSHKPGGSFGDDLTARVTLEDGTVQEYAIPRGAQRYEGPMGEELAESSKGMGGGGGGGGGRFTPGQQGHGFYPAYMGGSFPDPFMVDFEGMESAPFNFTDPMEFAKEYGEFNRGEYAKNFEQSQQFALEALRTEMAGLQEFAPAAQALKHEMLSLDNVRNQDMRTAQLDQAMPGMRGALRGQTDRAQAFAEGRLPEGMSDRAFELGVRSASADRSAAGGFGERSSVARSGSDLMSVRERIGLSQYGDQLLTSNSQLRQGMELAPTQYSDAGAQIQARPEVGAARLASQTLNELNALTTTPTTAAMSTKIGQEQFGTQLEQRTREFNATNSFKAALTNQAVANQFGMAKFGYDVSFAGAVAGAHQTDYNTEMAIQQQELAQQIYQDHFDQAQDAGTAGSIASGVGAIGGILDVISDVAGTVDDIISGDEDEEVAEDVVDDGGGDGGGVETPARGPSHMPSGPETPSGPPPMAGESAPEAVDVPAGVAVPDTHTPVGTNVDGSIHAVPRSRVASEARSFNADTGANINPEGNAQTTRALMTANGITMKAAGISNRPKEGYEKVGYDRQGAAVYSNTRMRNDQNSRAGESTVDGIARVLDPFGVMSAEDKTTMQQIAAASSDTAFAARLTAMASGGAKPKDFVNTLLNKYGYKALDQLTDSPDDRAGLGAAFTAYKLFQSWDKLSNSQRGQALASMGMQGYQYATGEKLGSKVIPATDLPGIEGGGMTVNQAMGLVGSGINAYALASNWGQMNDLNRLVGGTNTVASIAQTAQQFNLLGTGSTGAAAAADAATLAANGFTSAPNLGVGAITADVGAAIPSGYTQVATEGGKVVAMPAGNAASFSGIVQGAAGVAGIVGGAMTIAESWGSGTDRGALNGALGGASLAMGLSAVGVGLGPLGIAGVVAFSALSGLMKTGKHEEQVHRDGIRDHYAGLGLIDEGHNLTLADGTKFFLGSDGSENRGVHSFTNLDRVAKGQENINAEGGLHSYDIDYTNDLDFFSGMSGISLSRLVGGGKSKAIDQMGNYVANGALSSVGHGQEMTRENFSKTMENNRAFYAQAGISSKSEAYQLANMMYAEGRIDDMDLISMHQSFNMMYDDDGYELAQTLAKGRFEGVELAVGASEMPERPAPREVENSPARHEQDKQRQRAPGFFHPGWSTIGDQVSGVPRPPQRPQAAPGWGDILGEPAQQPGPTEFAAQANENLQNLPGIGASAQPPQPGPTEYAAQANENFQNLPGWSALENVEIG